MINYFRIGSYVSINPIHVTNAQYNTYCINGLKKNITAGNVKIFLTGRRSQLNIKLSVPSNWSDHRLYNWIKNHLPKKKLNKTLVAASVKDTYNNIVQFI